MALNEVEVIANYSDDTWVDGEIPEAVIPPIDIIPEVCTPQMPIKEN